MTKDYVSIPAAGRLLGVCPKTAREIIADERMEVIRPGKQDRVRRRDVIEYRRRCQTTVEREERRTYENVLAD
jgi:hypothetical protein